MRIVLIIGVIMAILIVTIAVTTSASTFNNKADGISADNYSLKNLKHLSEKDLLTYLSVYNADPYFAQVEKLKKNGMNNSSIEKTFAENGIYYNVTANVFVSGGRPGTPEELSRSIAPAYPFNDVKTDKSAANQALFSTSAVTSDPVEHCVVMSVFNNVYQGVQVNMKAGSLAVSASHVKQHVAPIHVGANGVWIEVGVVNRPGEGHRPYIYDPTQAGYPNGGWFYYDGLWDVSDNTYNNYKIYVVNTGGSYTKYVVVNGQTYFTLGTSTYNNNVDCTNEAWSYGNIWDAHDSTHTVAKNMYILSGTTWNAWQVAGSYRHWSPVIGCALSNSFSTAEGTAKMETWLT